MIVSKWGNSLAVRLPRKLVEQMGLAPGDAIEIVDVSNRMLMVEKDQRRKRALDSMRARRWTLPADYKFDRDEANER
jgi:antitoxin MazE